MKAQEKRRRDQMRQQGFADGRVGRPARHLDADYQRAWRRGRDSRKADDEKEEE